MKITPKFSFTEYVDVRKIGFPSWPFDVNWTAVVITVVTAVVLIVVSGMLWSRKKKGAKTFHISVRGEFGESVPYKAHVTDVVFMASPRNGVDGEVLNPDCKLVVCDEHGNGVPGIYVELKLDSGYCKASLKGNCRRKTGDKGIVLFPGLKIVGAGAGFSIIAVSGDCEARSKEFSIMPPGLDYMVKEPEYGTKEYFDTVAMRLKQGNKSDYLEIDGKEI